MVTELGWVYSSSRGGGTAVGVAVLVAGTVVIVRVVRVDVVNQVGVCSTL